MMMGSIRLSLHPRERCLSTEEEELAAIRQVFAALEPLPPRARHRVLGFVNDREAEDQEARDAAEWEMQDARRAVNSKPTQDAFLAAGWTPPKDG